MDTSWFEDGLKVTVFDDIDGVLSIDKYELWWICTDAVKWKDFLSHDNSDIHWYKVKTFNMKYATYLGLQNSKLVSSIKPKNKGNKLMDSENKGVSHKANPKTYENLIINIEESEMVELKESCEREEKPDIQEDVVNNPSHYTSHPSGIECCEISSYLNSPLAQAFQYIFRGKLKDEYKQEVKKSLWWLNKLEEIIYENCECSVNMFCGSEDQKYEVIDKLMHVEESEEDKFKSTFYKMLWYLLDSDDNKFVSIMIDWVEKEIELIN